MSAPHSVVSSLQMLRALRIRLVLFFAGVLTTALLAFGGTVYVAAVIAEAAEDEPEAEKQRELAAIRRLLALASLTGIPIAIAAALAGAHLLSRHALASVGRIVRTANTLTLEHLDARIASDPGAGPEIEELIAALNAMLDRIARAANGLRRFTADAAHELRTPLAVVSSQLEVCLRHPRDPEALREAIGTALEGLASLGRLVDLLLTLVRTDAGQLPVSPTRVDLAELVLQIAAPFECVASERDLRLVLALPEPGAASCTVTTDPLLVGRALANLLDNACKYCSSGGTITIRLNTSASILEIAVLDSGPGMSADDLAHAGDRFYRGPRYRGSTEGYGLGLALTREFMRVVGGQLTLAPGQPRGTEARLTLPSNPTTGQAP